jgi:hypothetical protein
MDTYDYHNPRNPINEIECEVEDVSEDPVTELQNALKTKTEILNYKIWQLSKLAEIEGDLATFGSLTIEQEQEKIEILNQYRK